MTKVKFILTNNKIIETSSSFRLPLFTKPNIVVEAARLVCIVLKQNNVSWKVGNQNHPVHIITESVPSWREE